MTIFLSQQKPFRYRSPGRCLKEARRFRAQWLKECGGRKRKKLPCVRLKVLKDDRGRGRKVFLHRFWGHIRTKDKHDASRRASLLPCVRDLLKNVKEKPVKSGDAYIFEGKTPGGDFFKVVLKEMREDNQDRLCLLTFYPFKK